MYVRAAFVLTCLCWLSSSSCVTNRFRPDAWRKDWNQARRDPDPRRNPSADAADARWPWAQPQKERIRGPGETTAMAAPPAPADTEDDAAIDLAKRTVAVVLAAVVGGWAPLVGIGGTFDEVPERFKAPRSPSSSATSSTPSAPTPPITNP